MSSGSGGECAQAEATCKQEWVIRGGASVKPWVPKVTTLDDKEFMQLAKRDPCFCEFIGVRINKKNAWAGKNFLEYLLHLRNGLVEEQEAKAVEDEDPYADPGSACGRRVRKIFQDEIPKYAELTIPAIGDLESHSMFVGTTVHNQGRLLIECGDDNAKYLYKISQVECPFKAETRVPIKEAEPGQDVELEEEHVKWNPDTQILSVTYKDSAGKRKQETRRIPTMQDANLWRACLTQSSKELEAFYIEHHVGARKRGRPR